MVNNNIREKLLSMMVSEIDELELLKSEVQNRFGKKLNSSFESANLSDHIKKSTGSYISPQTLRRFFGFIDDNTKPSPYTISILLDYCKRESLQELKSIEQNRQTKQISTETVFTIKEFYNIELSPEFDFNFQKACGNIAKLITSDTNLLNKLSGYLCKNSVSQIFFFERHPFIDGLCNGYSQYVEAYIKEKNTSEAMLFGYCLIHLGLILSQRNKEADKLLKKINNIEANDSIHPFVQARKIMANLLNANIKSDKFALQYWTELAFQEEKKQTRYPVKEAYFPFYQFILADAFNLIGQFDNALEMIHIAETDYKKIDKAPIEEGYYTALNLIKAIAFYKIGKQKESKQLLLVVNNEELVFSSKKYFLLQRLHLELKMTKSRSTAKMNKLTDSINFIVKETGFTCFSFK